MFQPAEEGPGGALPMIEEGILDNPSVNAAVALHLWAELEVGTIGIRTGPVLACADRFTLTVTGQGGHGAQPHLTRDPVVASAQLVQALQTIVSRSVNPLQSVVVTVGTINGGSAFNIIPETVTLQGTVRLFDVELRAMVQDRIREIAVGVGTATGCTIDVDYQEGYPPTVNDAAMAAMAREVAADIVGEQNVIELPPSLGGEDMSYVLERVPGVFVMIGHRNESIDAHYPHHHPRFNIDERSLPIGVEFLNRMVDRYFAG
jgi:amidohydrolase